MMKGFWKSGKWMGLLILALAFAGCAGGSGSSSSSEPALAGGPGVHGIPITVDTNHQTISFGDEGAAGGRATVNGHVIDLVNGSTACGGAGPTVSCWIKLINRDPTNYMANAFVLGTTCPLCTSALIHNADLTHDGVVNGTNCGVGGINNDPDGNAGCGNTSADIDGLGMCYVEDGEYKITGQPYNDNNCKIHDSSQPGVNRPDMILHPQCGQSTVRWDFDGQSGTYTFMGQIQAQWFPQDPTGDSRMDMQNYATFFIMAANLNNNAGIGATLNGQTWLRPGAYRRSEVISGFGATASNSIPVGGYFAVNVALDYPDRMESQKVANTALSVADKTYEYYWNYDFILHYNPKVVQLVQGKNGARTVGATVIYQGTSGIAYDDKDCLVRGASDYCTNPQLATFSGLGPITSYNGISWIGLDAGLDNGLGKSSFAAHQTGVYNTFYGGVGHLNLGGTYYYASPQYLVAPKMNAHYGRAHLNIPKGGSRTWSEYVTTVANLPSASWLVKQEGVDAAPDLPLAMYYFWVPNNPALSGRGSEFFIEAFGSQTNLNVGRTQGTIYPGGVSAGTDDSLTVCIPYQTLYADGCDPALIGSYWVYAGYEQVNALIGQSGPAVKGGSVSFGGIQQWSANICVQ